MASFRTAHDGKRSLVPLSDVDIINRARYAEGMKPLPTNEELNEALKFVGFTECAGKPYPWVEVA